MNYSSTFEARMRNSVRFQETFEEHAFRLTGSPRGNVCLGTRQMKATPLMIMKEERAGEGIHANGSPKVRVFRYELVMLRNAQCRTLAISQDKTYCGREDCGRGGNGEGSRIISCALRNNRGWEE